MESKKHWFRKLLVLGAVGAGLIPALILGLWGYVSATAPTLHPAATEVPTTSSAAISPEWSAAAERAMAIALAALVEQNLPGMSVAVGMNGSVVWAGGLGWADMENRVPVALDTPFRIGSASMMLTSAAVGLLLEKQRLRLDDEIQVAVPAFPKKPWPVTLRQVMGHLAGIRGDAGDEESLRQRCSDVSEGLRRFADADLRAEPGARYRFSLYNWMLVSAAVEAAGEEPFFTFMRRQVFEPVGMTDTKSDSGKVPIPNKPVFYFPRFAADPKYGPQEPSEVDYSCLSGSSAFLSTASDMVRFLMAFNAARIVKPETVQLLQASQRTSDGVDTGYGLGWDLETVTLAGQPVSVIGHDGDLAGGLVSSFMTFPGRGLVVAVITNIAHADTPTIARQVAEAFTGHERIPRN